MFVSKEHHSQLLPPDCYASGEQYEVEIARLFQPAWHCVGVLGELPKDGSFRTLELLGNPLILWRVGNEVHAYLNVCAHRYCLLTHAACGVAERLKCQYHGWEYDETGNVRCIPDARTFRPLEPGMLGLKKYHAELCGQLVFVSLADNPPSLQEFLGPGYDTCREWFTADLHLAVVCDRQIEANWKVLVENALESYHTTEVHPRTFGQSPAEQDCTHDLTPGWTALTVDYTSERSLRRLLDWIGHRMVGAAPRNQYQHILHYPHVMLSRLSLYTWFECVIPLSPTRSRSIVRVLCNVGRPGSLRRVWNKPLISRWAQSFLMQVGREDAAVMPDVQRGMMAHDRPLGGLISTREERITHFQQFVQAATDAATQCRTEPTGGNPPAQVEVSWKRDARTAQSTHLPR